MSEEKETPKQEIRLNDKVIKVINHAAQLYSDLAEREGSEIDRLAARELMSLYRD